MFNDNVYDYDMIHRSIVDMLYKLLVDILDNMDILMDKILVVQHLVDIQH